MPARQKVKCWEKVCGSVPLVRGHSGVRRCVARRNLAGQLSCDEHWVREGAHLELVALFGSIITLVYFIVLYLEVREAKIYGQRTALAAERAAAWVEWIARQKGA